MNTIKQNCYFLECYLSGIDLPELKGEEIREFISFSQKYLSPGFSNQICLNFIYDLTTKLQDHETKL